MAGLWPQLEFQQPEWLAALVLVLPVLCLFLVRSLADLPYRQLWAVFLVRSAIVVCLLLALAGFSWLTSTDRVFVVFAVDESLSIDPDGQALAADYIAAATSGIGASSFAVLPFARGPAPFRAAADGMRRDALPPPPASSENSVVEPRDFGLLTDAETKWKQATNLQSVIEVAAAYMPPTMVPHLVLMTDGNETTGDVASAVAAARTRISTVPLPTRSEDEIQVTAVNVPAQVAEGEPFRIEVIVDTNHDDNAVVELFGGEYRIASESKELKQGENRFYFTQQIDKPTQFSAQIKRPVTTDEGSAQSFRDTLLDNNIASGLVFTAGKPRVLLIDDVPETARHIEWAMAEEGIKVDTRPPRGMPDSITELQNYEVLILSNVPATKLTSGQMEVIRSWVSELGGGFIMLGGDQSFGLGGYYKTVVEDVLPVRSDFEKEKEKPGLGMVLIIDKSGSMGGQKIELAKEAARAAVDLLGNKDQIGVIAFDGQPYWISEVTSAAQKGLIADRIASIEPGGGTTLYPALEQAWQALQATTAKLKHVIVLTDGHSTPGDFEAIVRDMASARMTVSTVGIGDADQGLLERLADIGSGRYYFSSDATSIPQIFAKETMTASKSALNEEPFLPMLMRATPVLDGVDFGDAPFLLGYVVTRPKATSEVILASETGDPLLCWWRYGLGMSVAFTSDAKSRWAAEWLTWPGYNQLWAQVIRHCMRKRDTQGLSVDIHRYGDLGHVVIDAMDANGGFLNQAETELTLVDPKLKAAKIPVTQTAPGRYEADVALGQPGAWHLQISQQLNGQLVHQQLRALVVGYSDELRIRSPNNDLLRSIAAQSGGSYAPDSSAVFQPQNELTASTAAPLWPFLLSLTAMLFVLDVALRRLDLPRLFGSERNTRRRLLTRTPASTSRPNS